MAIITTCNADCCLKGFPPRCVSNGLCNIFCCKCNGGCAFQKRSIENNFFSIGMKEDVDEENHGYSNIHPIIENNIP
uniref:Uncharacterized protein n=1 Tax=Panagrolaimus sp. PS1159 TaxID=55785 RepID=A0AC35F2G0_9BILA